MLPWPGSVNLSEGRCRTLPDVQSRGAMEPLVRSDDSRVVGGESNGPDGSSRESEEDEPPPGLESTRLSALSGNQEDDSENDDDRGGGPRSRLGSSTECPKEDDPDSKCHGDADSGPEQVARIAAHLTTKTQNDELGSGRKELPPRAGPTVGPYRTATIGAARLAKWTERDCRDSLQSQSSWAQSEQSPRSLQSWGWYRWTL